MIDPRYYGLIEMAMSFGIVGIFVAWQLWSLRTKPGKGGDSDKN